MIEFVPFIVYTNIPIINEYNIYRIDQFGSMVYEQPSEMGTPFAYIDSFTMSSNLNFHLKHYNERSMIGK